MASLVLFEDNENDTQPIKSFVNAQLGKPNQFDFELKLMESAIHHDSWGSLEEASNDYTQLSTNILKHLVNIAATMKAGNKDITNYKNEIEFLKRIILAIRLRHRTLIERDALEDSTDLIVSLKDIRLTFNKFQQFNKIGLSKLGKQKFPGNFINKTHKEMIELEDEIKNSSSNKQSDIVDISKEIKEIEREENLSQNAQRVFENTNAELDSLINDMMVQEEGEHQAPINFEDGTYDVGHDYDTEYKAAGGQLINGYVLNRINYKKGHSYLSITVIKAGQKDVQKRKGGYVDPFVTCSVYDKKGNVICDEQYTRISKNFEEKYIVFNNTLSIVDDNNCTFHLPISIEEMQARYEVGVFFELKHYKPNKSRNSTRCWAFFELDEIIDGEIRCEWVSIFITHTLYKLPKQKIEQCYLNTYFHAKYKLSNKFLFYPQTKYKKPIDVIRKRIKLHTIKDLFLHLELKIRKVE